MLCLIHEKEQICLTIKLCTEMWWLPIAWKHGRLWSTSGSLNSKPKRNWLPLLLPGKFSKRKSAVLQTHECALTICKTLIIIFFIKCFEALHMLKLEVLLMTYLSSTYMNSDRLFQTKEDLEKIRMPPCSSESGSPALGKRVTSAPLLPL